MPSNISERPLLAALELSNQAARQEMEHINEAAKRRRKQGGIPRRPLLAAIRFSNQVARQEMEHINEAAKRRGNRS